MWESTQFMDSYPSVGEYWEPAYRRAFRARVNFSRMITMWANKIKYDSLRCLKMEPAVAVVV